MPDGKVCPEQFRGWLLKWTNYIKGYQRRWFVLANGLLSYYRYICGPEVKYLLKEELRELLSHVQTQVNFGHAVGAAIAKFKRTRDVSTLQVILTLHL